MARYTLFHTIFFLFILICACATEEKKEKEIDRDILRKEISDNWEQFILSWEEQDPSACASIFTENGQNIPPNADILKGRDAIREFYEFLFSNNISSEYTHHIESLDFFDNAILEQGNFQVVWLQNDSTESVFSARSLTHWVRQADGWRIERFMFNQPGE